MIIEITEEDIKNGWNWSGKRMYETDRRNYHVLEKERSFNCPVAVALMRIFKEKVSAEMYHIFIGDKKYRTPEIVSDWMYSFDMGEDVKPFSFVIEEINENT